MQPVARISRMLVGIDDSREARVAQEHALHIARRLGAEMVLAHACPRPEISRLSHRSPAVFQKLVLPEILSSAESPEEDGPGGLKVAKLFIDGSPDPGIADAASECRADLVVIGTHGRSGIRRALLGSVAERTVRHARTGVLVARGTARPGGYRHILVATDFSAAAEQALRLAMALAAPECAVEILHCWSSPVRAVGIPVPASMSAAVPIGAPTAVGGGVGAVLAGHDVYEIAMTEGRRLVALYRHESIELAFSLARERPMQAILERLDSGAYDLCAMGGHGRQGLRRLLLGSVTEHVVRRAPCSVLVGRVDGVTRSLRRPPP